MREEQLSRLEKLIGLRGVYTLSEKKILIFGLGGVGGYVAEALARSGVGALTLVDGDKVDVTNLNRQLIATHDSIGETKVEAFRKRIASIDPEIMVDTYELFFLPESDGGIDVSRFDYVVDAVDTVKAKVEIAVRCREASVPLIAAMGCGNRLDPSKLKMSDIYDTSVDPLSKVMRKELRKRGIETLKVVYSTEEPVRPVRAEEAFGQAGPGSSAFVPPAAGLLIASCVVRDLIE